MDAAPYAPECMEGELSEVRGSKLRLLRAILGRLEGTGELGRPVG
jgi:hypothetical protein